MPRKDGTPTRAELAEAGRLIANRQYIAKADDAELARLALDECVQGDPDVSAMVTAEQARRAPANGLTRCDCGCKYWTEDGRCYDCGGRPFPVE